MTEIREKDTVLVVDDAPETLGLLTEILEREDMTALVARSAGAALALLQRITPDVVLMDAVMPEMDGFQACEEIKKQNDLSHIPIIFMTGLAETEHIVRAFDAGGVDYVTKPIRPEEIMARIRTHLANSRMAQSARMALDISGRSLVAVDARGNFLWNTPQVNEVLTSLPGFDTEKLQSWWSGLKEKLLDIIENQRRDVELVTEVDGVSVTASYLGQVENDEYLLRLNDSHNPSELDVLERTFELTSREAEVLLWIAQGKTNRDIAEILSCSPRTVNKHLEHIYDKLGVENRTSAGIIAVRTIVEK